MSVRDLITLVLCIPVSLVVVGCILALLQVAGVEEPPALAVLAIFLGAPTAFYYAVKRRRARKRAAVAQSLGLVLSTESNQDLRCRLALFPLFSQPSGQIGRNRFHAGLDGVDITVFDYSHARVSPYASWLAVVAPGAVLAGIRLVTETVVLCECTDLILPQFFLYLHRRAGRDMSLLGNTLGEDVLIPSDFSYRYVLRGVEPDRIHSLFTQSVLCYCMEHDGLQVEAFEGMLLTYRPGRLVPGSRLMEAVKEATGLLHLLRTASQKMGQ